MVVSKCTLKVISGELKKLHNIRTLNLVQLAGIDQTKRRRGAEAVGDVAMEAESQAAGEGDAGDKQPEGESMEAEES